MTDSGGPHASRSASRWTTRVAAAPTYSPCALEEELIASGARPRREALTGRDALTPAEYRVAQLAMQGLSNREIAQASFVTIKTIETQLSRVYDKLGVASRTRLASALSTE